MTTCPLCGFQFDPAGLSCAAHCPLAAVQGCQLVCCPHCGYPLVDERQSRLATFLRRVLTPAHPTGVARGGPKL